MNTITEFSKVKYTILIGTPILFDLLMAKALEKAIFEYDVSFLLVALTMLISFLVIILKKIVKHKFSSINFLDVLVLFVVSYNFLIIFGKAPSFAELLNI